MNRDTNAHNSVTYSKEKDASNTCGDERGYALAGFPTKFVGTFP